MSNISSKQQILIFSWYKPFKNYPIFLKPKYEISGWSTDGENAYLSTLSDRLTIQGSKLYIYKASTISISGYKVLDGFDDLFSKFTVSFLK